MPDSNFIVLVLVPVLSLAIAIPVLRRYFKWEGTNKLVYLSTLLGYFFSILVVFLMPLDVAVTSYLSCEYDRTHPPTPAFPPVDPNATNSSSSPSSLSLPSFESPSVLWESSPSTPALPTGECIPPFSYVDPFILIVVWNVIYWTTYVATWLLYPILQSYATAGEFTVKGRIIFSIKDNLFWYGVAAAAGVVVFVMLWLIVGIANFSIALNVAILVASMWGILVLILLLGYGLVFIPRDLWHRGNRTVALKYAQFQLIGYQEQFEEALFELEKTLKLAKKFDEKLEKLSPDRAFLDEIIALCPQEYAAIKKGEGDADLTEQGFVNLKAKLMADLHVYHSASTLFDETYKEALDLERIIEARNLSWLKRVDEGHAAPGVLGILSTVRSYIVWFWNLISPVAWKVLSILAGLLSLALVYSELVIVVPGFAQYSVFALLVTLGLNDGFLLQLFCLLCIAYIALCAYVSLFKLKLFSFYQLLPHQRTDANSILFSAAYLSRLVGVIALNFVHVINFTKTSVTSPFLTMMRSDPIQNWIYQYFPFVLVFLCIATIFNLFNRVLSLCNVKSFQFSASFDDEQIEEGARLMFRERQARARGGTVLKGPTRLLLLFLPPRMNE